MNPTGQVPDDHRYLSDSARRVGVDPDSLDPPPRRESEAVGGSGIISALRWGRERPSSVAVHGGGQNAHTWDSFALAYGSALLAIDLPGHGHSSWRADRDYSPQSNALLLAEFLDAKGMSGVDYIGMSLGGLTGIALAADRPDLVRTLVVVDVTPGVRRTYDSLQVEDRGATVLVRGQRTFESFDELVDATHRSTPSRRRESVAIGAFYNSLQRDDGRWAWRYDVLGSTPGPAYDRLWESLARIEARVLLVRGGNSRFVSDEDAERFAQAQPTAVIATVADAGHSVQGDRPSELATVMREFVEVPGGRG